MAAETVPKVWMIMMSLSVLIQFQNITEFVEEELSFLIFEFTEDINCIFLHYNTFTCSAEESTLDCEFRCKGTTFNP